MSSYSLSERVNTSAVIQWSGGAILRAVAASETYIMGGFVTVFYALFMFAGVYTLVNLIPAQLWLGLAITAAFGYATYPRSKARPSHCPYCQSPNISGGMGNYDCNDCGRSWSV